MPYNPEEIYQGEIFRKSRCIDLEHQVLTFIQNQIKKLKYSSLDQNGTKWEKQNKSVIVRLVDDITTCSSFGKSTSNLFDKNTIVLTDNKVTVDTEYQVIKLPDSFFGIYYYRPIKYSFNPKKLVNLSINRMDPLRLIIFMDFLLKTDNLYCNFNCISNSPDETVEDVFNVLGPDIVSRYQVKFSEIINQMPLKNHSMTLEQSMQSSFVNAVIETYSGNNVIALSEKIFRALQTPAPWTVYSGRGTVNFLKNMGFDVLDDIIDHSYNCCDFSAPLETTGSAITFVNATIENSIAVSKISTQYLIDRCRTAAEHNQAVLKKMRQQWPIDLAQWWPQHIHYVK
jgi:hypothetical protein